MVVKCQLRHGEMGSVIAMTVITFPAMTVRLRNDTRLSTGRPAKVAKLSERLLAMGDAFFTEFRADEDEELSDDAAKMLNLITEFSTNVEKMFVFVLHPQVEPTNNVSEQGLRDESMARKASRTSKTEKGAKRRGVILSVLASLKKQLSEFTLSTVIAEVLNWRRIGVSLFEEMLNNLRAASPAPSVALPHFHADAHHYEHADGYEHTYFNADGHGNEHAHVDAYRDLHADGGRGVLQHHARGHPR